ncbi:MAG: hypothetical protein HYW49_04325 [Deltaproteobacteria bacterium]|nr:hypothetical protein [Deltaproteobacteria bacterium]
MSENEQKVEILVVASKVKGYIKAAAGMNTSDKIMEMISNKVRQICDQAIANARNDGRKTVMDRDVT